MTHFFLFLFFIIPEIKLGLVTNSTDEYQFFHGMSSMGPPKTHFVGGDLSA